MEFGFVDEFRATVIVFNEMIAIDVLVAGKLIISEAIQKLYLAVSISRFTCTGFPCFNAAQRKFSCSSYQVK